MHKLCSSSGEQHQAIEMSPCSPLVSQWIIRKRHLETAATTVTVCGQAKNETEKCLETQCPAMVLIAEEGLLVSIWNISTYCCRPGDITSPVQIYHALQRMRHLCLTSYSITLSVYVLRIKYTWGKKKRAVLVQSLLESEETVRNKGKEWDFFSSCCVMQPLELSLSTAVF